MILPFCKRCDMHQLDGAGSTSCYFCGRAFVQDPQTEETVPPTERNPRSVVASDDDLDSDGFVPPSSEEGEPWDGTY